MREVIADAEGSLSDLRHQFKAKQDSVRRRCIERRDEFLRGPSITATVPTPCFGRKD